jgi:pimeloyl-ACP methyl ester carboxylesterase
MPKLQVDGAELHYEDTGGSGTPVVLAHGLLWSGKLYRFQVEALRKSYRCITFDFRGQGQSEITRSGYDMDTLALDAAQLIEKLNAKPCHFVGLSMGGFVGMRLAARRPELFRSLVLLETAGDEEPPLNRPKYRLMGMFTRVFGTRPLVKPIMDILFGKTFMRDPARAALRNSLRDELVGNDVRGSVLATGGVIDRRSVMGELSRIGTPTLVLHGDEDVAIKPARAKRTADLIPGSTFQTVPRAGHSSTLEAPEAVNAALQSFFAAH